MTLANRRTCKQQNVEIGKLRSTQISVMSHARVLSQVFELKLKSFNLAGNLNS
jgi:hypothetical protein